MSVLVLCLRSEVVPSSSKRLACPVAPAATVSVTASSGFWTSLVTSLLRVGTIPPDLTNTGMVSSPVVMLWVVPPAYVLPVNQSVHPEWNGHDQVTQGGSYQFHFLREFEEAGKKYKMFAIVNVTEAGEVFLATYMNQGAK